MWSVSKDEDCGYLVFGDPENCKKRQLDVLITLSRFYLCELLYYYVILILFAINKLKSFSLVR